MLSYLISHEVLGEVWFRFYVLLCSWVTRSRWRWQRDNFGETTIGVHRGVLLCQCVTAMLLVGGWGAAREEGVSSPPQIIRNEGIWDYLPSCTTNYQPFPWISIANAACANTDNYKSTWGYIFLLAHGAITECGDRRNKQ